MELYGHPWSINTRKVLMVAAEKGHALPLRVLHLPRGEHLSAAHALRHPFHKVPVLDDDGFVVYETAAILRYLDDVLDGPSLWPTDPRAAARALQWDRVQQSYFEPAVHPGVVHLIFARHIGFPPDGGVIATARQRLGEVLDVIEPHLAEHPYLSGAAFGLADINWMPYLDYLTAVGEGGPITARPAVRAWFDAVTSRPGWQAVARTGMQPFHADADADTIATLHGWKAA